MKKISITSVPGRVKKQAKKALYSSKGRESARATLNTLKTSDQLLQYRENQKILGILERASSEELPKGKYFAKLTIHDWEKYRNQKFRLTQAGKIVYGNQIEPPARGFPLEYRNIPVTSTQKNKFKLNIPARFDIEIREVSFTTKQQRDYDIKYKVIQDDEIFYSLRGNTKNPSKIIITFPGFGPSTTRISYAISYLKALTDKDLSDTLMICFQDRYMVSGTYMMVDSARRPLYPRVKAVIDKFLNTYNIDDSNMLIFGASKGGSIAIHYAQEYPNAHLILGVPQLNLPYYMNKPFFRYNLFEVGAFHKMKQPEELLRSYFKEGRKIDYFYTNNDELSNYSVIELAHGIKGLTKYRFDGTHGEVAKAALPTMLNIMRRFLGQGKTRKITCENVKIYGAENLLYSQVRIQDGLDRSNDANWFLEANDGSTIHRVALTNHTYDFVKYTNSKQALFPAYDPISKFNAVVGSADTGLTYRASLPEQLNDVSDNEHPIDRSFAALSPDTNGNINQYTVVNENSLGRFLYRSKRINENGVTAEVHFVDDIKSSSYVKPASVQSNPTKSLVVAQPIDTFNFASIFALRNVISNGCTRLRIVVHSDKLDAEELKKLVKTEWVHVQVVVVRPVKDLDYNKNPFANWEKKRRLNILNSAKLGSPS